MAKIHRTPAPEPLFDGAAASTIGVDFKEVTEELVQVEDRTSSASYGGSTRSRSGSAKKRRKKRKK